MFSGLPQKLSAQKNRAENSGNCKQQENAETQLKAKDIYSLICSQVFLGRPAKAKRSFLAGLPPFVSRDSPRAFLRCTFETHLILSCSSSKSLPPLFSLRTISMPFPRQICFLRNLVPQMPLQMIRSVFPMCLLMFVLPQLCNQKRGFSSGLSHKGLHRLTL